MVNGVNALLEAILFVAEHPVPTGELAEVLELPAGRVEEELTGLAERLREREAGLTLRQVAAGWRLYAVPEAAPYLERFATTASATRLSAAALETLAVVAYRQPVSRTQVSEIRGVDSDSSLRTLERRSLIEEVGRLPLPGNPVIYGTTELFLEKMGINAVEELPPLADHVPPADIVEALEEPYRA